MTTAPKLIREQLLALAALVNDMADEHDKVFRVAKANLINAELRSLAAESVGGDSYVTFDSSGIHVDLNRFLSTDAGKALIKPAAKVTHSADGQSQLELTADGLVLGIGEHDLYAKQPDSAEGDSYEKLIIAPLDKELSANLRDTGEGKGDEYVAEDTAAMDRIFGEQPKAEGDCTCPSGDGSLRWPCPKHPPWKLLLEDLDEEMKFGNALCGAAADAIRQLQTRLSAAPQPEQPARDCVELRWIPVTERLPKDDFEAVVRYRYTDKKGRPWDVGLSIYDSQFEDNCGWLFGSCNYAEVSHWMPREALLAHATQPPQQADGGAVAVGEITDYLSMIAGYFNATVRMAERPIIGTKLYAAHPPKSPGVGDDQVRDSFENWADPQGLRLDRLDLYGSARSGPYCDDSTQLAWEAYRESAACNGDSHV